MLDGVTWFQTDDFGVVDRTESEAIVTSFYTVILPVWPEHSAYVSRDDDGTERRIAIPLQTKSVVLGYLRAPLWLAATVLAAPAMIDGRELWLVPALLIALLATLLTFVAGRLPEEERLRRALLRRVVGFGAPPELLTEDVRSEVRANLLTVWNARSPKRRWKDAIVDGEPHELLIALAEYHQDPELVELARANYANKLWN